ncbi:MAG TPA: cellulase family glycosylhydrolase [Steroidobacteraceae bacterium]|nr:cellulase family glycosylhydrolase [Steroidobacteraceae bacterium]
MTTPDIEQHLASEELILETGAMSRRLFLGELFLLASSLCSPEVRAQVALPRIATARGKFVTSDSGSLFTPWGFNYDRDSRYRLLEEYWGREWKKVDKDFRTMRGLGANVVRIHLQYHQFMDGLNSPNQGNLARLRDLVDLSQSLGIYLDITGLGSYRPENDPLWYVNLSERDRWIAQSQFWATIAKTLADKPGIFTFNLMNEPIVSGDVLEQGAWVHANSIRGLHYNNFINLDPKGRDRTSIASAWIDQMRGAIRKYDKQRLITLGAFPLFGSANATGFEPKRISSQLDFISVHLYPEAGRVREGLELLRQYQVGLPILLEETFALNGTVDEYRRFLSGSRHIVDGWLSFYWGDSETKGNNSATLVPDVVKESMDAFRAFKQDLVNPSAHRG